jgi:hypothetical protein
VRANVDWDPSENLSVQAVLEHGQDDYKRAWATVPAQLIENIAGARVVSIDSMTLDATYKLSDSWKFNGFWTHTENRWKVNKSNLGDDTRNTTDTYGVGVSGKATPRMVVGMDLLAANEMTTLQNLAVTSNVGGIGNIAGWTAQALPGNYLPNISYNTLKLNIYGVYELDKKSAIKVNFAYQEFKSDDWQWGYNGVPFVYSDNTTVSNPNQIVSFVGVAYVHKF